MDGGTTTIFISTIQVAYSRTQAIRGFYQPIASANIIRPVRVPGEIAAHLPLSEVLQQGDPPPLDKLGPPGRPRLARMEAPDGEYVSQRF